METRRLRPAVAVGALDGVDVIEVGDPRQGGGGLPLPGRVVGDRGGEAGVADEQAGHLVVAQVVDRRRGQDEVGPGPPQGLGDPPARLVVVEDGQVAELQAEVIGPDQVGRRPRLAPADLGDRLGVMLGAAAIAGRHRRHRQVTARLAQAAPASRRTGTRYRRGGRATPGLGWARPWQISRHDGASRRIHARDLPPTVRRGKPLPPRRSNRHARSLPTPNLRLFRKMFSRALADRCTLATKGSIVIARVVMCKRSATHDARAMAYDRPPS